MMSLLQFLAANYDKLPPEMQQAYDNIVGALTEQIGAALQVKPDTSESRQMKRLYTSIKNNFPTAKSLVISMESPNSIKGPFFEETKCIFEKHCQVTMDALFEAMESSFSGAASFAKLSLLLSCIDELVCALHLAQHSYVNQSYSHIRTVFESLNMVLLFVKDGSYADLWISNKEEDQKRKKKELKPANVRTILGIKKDPVYAFLSSHGPHTSFEYVQSKSFRKGELSSNGKPSPTIAICLSGTQSMRHIYTANMGCVVALGQVLMCVGRAFGDRVHPEDFPSSIMNYAKDLKEYMLCFLRNLADEGFDADEIGKEMSSTLLKNIDDAIAAYTL
jgi:hypothetical protein